MLATIISKNTFNIFSEFNVQKFRIFPNNSLEIITIFLVTRNYQYPKVYRFCDSLAPEGTSLSTHKLPPITAPSPTFIVPKIVEFE